MFELRAATVEDAEAIAETVQLGFDSFRTWAGSNFDPPPATLELQRTREGLARASTWAVVAFSEGVPAGHVSLTQAREREEPRAKVDISDHRLSPGNVKKSAVSTGI